MSVCAVPPPNTPDPGCERFVPVVPGSTTFIRENAVQRLLNLSLSEDGTSMRVRATIPTPEGGGGALTFLEEQLWVREPERLQAGETLP